MSSQLNEIPIKTPVRVLQKHDLPALELRRFVQDVDICKELIRAAFYDKPLVILPQFTDKFKALASLQEKGLIYWDSEDNQWYFNL